MKYSLWRMVLLVALICICFFTACSRKDEPEYAPVEETQASPADTSDGLGEDTKYKIEDFVEIKDLPENVIWTEGAEPLGYIGVEPKPLVGETLKKVIENVGEEVYIGVFVKNFTSCGLVPQIRYGIEIFPEEVIADDNFLKLFIAANNSYEEYSKTAGELLAQGLKVYEIFVIEEFNRARDKAKDAYNAYYEYAGQLCKDMVFKYPNKEDYYEELHHTILKNHHIGMMETRNLFFSSFGFIPYYSIEYQEDNYDGYYGEGYDVDPGYVYVAKGKDIMALNEYFMGKSSATIISPISKEYSEIHKEVLQYKK